MVPRARVAGPPQLQGTVGSGEASRPRGPAEPGADPLVSKTAVATGTTRRWQQDEAQQGLRAVPRGAPLRHSQDRDTARREHGHSSAPAEGKHAQVKNMLLYQNLSLLK